MIRAVPFGVVPPAPPFHRVIAARGRRIRQEEGGYSWEREAKWERPGSVPNPNQEAMRRLARLVQPRYNDPPEDPLAPMVASEPLESRRWWRRLENWASPLGSGELGLSASTPTWPLARASETSAQDEMRLERTNWPRVKPTSVSRAEALWESACGGMYDELYSLRSTHRSVSGASAVGPREVAALRPGRRMSRRLQRRWQRQWLVMDWVYGRGWHDGETMVELLRSSSGHVVDTTTEGGLRGLRKASSAPLTGSHPYAWTRTLNLTGL
eukprot:scaffold61423_cov33-Phaeocystis_antarctica.AAC.1